VNGVGRDSVVETLAKTPTRSSETSNCPHICNGPQLFLV